MFRWDIMVWIEKVCFWVCDEKGVIYIVIEMSDSGSGKLLNVLFRWVFLVFYFLFDG